MKTIFLFISISKPMALKFRHARQLTDVLKVSPEHERRKSLTSKSLDAARDLEPVETALRVIYS